MIGAYFHALHRKLDVAERAYRDYYGIDLSPRRAGPASELAWCTHCEMPMRPRLDGLFVCPHGHLASPPTK